MGRVPGEQPETVTRQALAATIASALSSDTDGDAIDRDDLQFPDAARLIVNGANGLGNGSDDITFTVQDAADDGNGSPDTWADTSNTVQITNSSKRNAVEIDLTGLRRHIRLQHDVDDPSGQSLNADVDVVAEWVFSGMKVIPQS